MTSQTRATLKSYFNTNDQPTEAQFADLIDSGLNLADETNWTLGSGVDEYALCYDHDTARFVLRAPVAAFGAGGLVIASLPASDATQGATLLVNGTFATNDFAGWTAGAGWSAATGAAAHTAGSIETLTQDIAVTSGKIYQVAFTTTGRTAGSITLTIGAATLVVQVVATGTTAIITNGSYNTSFKASSTTTIAFTITPTTDYNGTIDTISIKEITAGSAALTVTDSSANPMFELRGKNGSTAGNIGIGIDALSNLTTAIHNTALGYDALQETTTGDGNTAVGKIALQYNQTGAWNTAVGMESLRRLISGDDNTAVGEGAAESLTTGSRNVAIGKYAMLLSTTPSDIVAVGGSALYFNVTGTKQTAVGAYALFKNTSDANTAIGYMAAGATTAENNTVVGAKALLTSTGGSNNVALGYSTMAESTSSFNVAIGHSALYFVKGDGNIAIGYHAGYGVTPANAVEADTNGILIGYRAGRSVVSATALSNYVGIGSEVAISKSNQVVLGNASITETLLYGNVGIGTADLLTYKLRVDGDIGLVGNGILDFGNGDVQLKNTSGVLSIKTWSAGTGLTEKMTILGTGNVGIGTATPATALHVVGAATITGGIRPAADSTTALQLQNVAGASVLNVDTTNARVGIGTSAPEDQLDVEKATGGTISIGTAGACGTDVSPLSATVNFRGYVNYITGAISVQDRAGSASGGWMKLKTSDASFVLQDRIMIDNAGNVGIADVAPAEKLDVTGNINATGVYKVGDVQVLSNRVIDARCADVANSGDATTDGLIDALRDAMILHGLIAAAA